MKNKKGFTLIELIAIIIIVAVVMILSFSSFTNTMRKNKLRETEDFKEKLINAATLYVESNLNNFSSLSTTWGFVTLTATDLIETGYLDKNISNPTSCIYDETVVGIQKQEDNTLYYDVYCKYFEDNNIPEPESFATDDWETIVLNVKTGNTSAYKVGDTKEITLTGEVAGTYKVRIANTSTPTECNTEGFSQTACGFVVEFEDIITKRVMNSVDTNVGGWEASEMRAYINDIIYNAIPTGLKGSITNTKVVSGHGNTSGETNFVTIDKVYLLSTKEVWGKEGTSNTISNDSAELETRQLDYYKIKGVTTSNYSAAIKKYKGIASYWWLRTATFSYAYGFYGVDSNGSDYNDGYNILYGVAPAFRIN